MIEIGGGWAMWDSGGVRFADVVSYSALPEIEEDKKDEFSSHRPPRLVIVVSSGESAGPLHYVIPTDTFNDARNAGNILGTALAAQEH